MRKCQPLGPSRVAGDNGLQNGGVLLPYLARPRGLPKHVAHGPAKKAPMRLRRRFDHGIARSRVNHSVQRLIQANLLDYGQSRGRFVAGVQDSPTLPLDGGGEWLVNLRPFRDDPRGVSIERRSNTVMLKHLAAIDRRYKKAAPTLFLDNPVRLQPGHCLLYRLAGNAQPFSELLLSKVNTRCQPPIANFVNKCVVHLIGEPT